MGILSKHLPFVKQQETFHLKKIEQKGITSFAANLHRETAEKFRALYVDIELADPLLDASKKSPTAASGPAKDPGTAPPADQQKRARLSLSMEDIADLPQELVKELNLTDGDKAEFAILSALEESGGLISLDRLLIALYRKTGDIHKRSALTNRLHRMSQRGRVFSVPGKKAIYSSEQLSASEAAAIFGAIKPEQTADDTTQTESTISASANRRGDAS